jgi:CHAT domain-containing protein
LNACQIGAAGELLGFVFGWPQAFLRMGATACIAPLWSVIDESAKDIATEFYGSVLKRSGEKPMALGEALRSIRSRWKEKKSLTYLGYVLYGDPTAALDWQ